MTTTTQIKKSTTRPQAKKDSICLPSVSRADKKTAKRLSQTGVNVLIKTLSNVF